MLNKTSRRNYFSGRVRTTTKTQRFDDTKITFVDFEWSDTLTYDEWKSDWDLTCDEWEEWEKRFNN